MKNPKVCIVGPGVVGLSTGRSFLAKGLEVAFFGRTESAVTKLKNEGFKAYERKDVLNGAFDFDITFLTVPTPTINGKINLDAMELAAIDLGKRIRFTKKYHLVVVKSTVPPGTTEELVIKTVEEYSGKKIGKDFGACMNPEYLREETAYDDALNPWVIAIGEYDKKSGDLLYDAYEKFNSPLFRCSIREAEMQKYVHNLYNAAKISFFNEMREIAKASGIDSEKVFNITSLSAEGMWNPKYGIKDRGPFSGSCLPKDTQAFLKWSEQKGYNADLLKTVIGVNDKHKERLGIKTDAHAIVSRL